MLVRLVSGAMKSELIASILFRDTSLDEINEEGGVEVRQRQEASEICSHVGREGGQARLGDRPSVSRKTLSPKNKSVRSQRPWKDWAESRRRGLKVWTEVALRGKEQGRTAVKHSMKPPEHEHSVQGSWSMQAA
jgi:hypothetical protein